MEGRRNVHSKSAVKRLVADNIFQCIVRIVNGRVCRKPVLCVIPRYSHTPRKCKPAVASHVHHESFDYIMRLFKRRSSDPNPQLVSLFPISDSESPATQPEALENRTSPKTSNGFTAWEKKVNHMLGQMKRNDSSKLLLINTECGNWSPNQTSQLQNMWKTSKKSLREDALCNTFSNNKRDAGDDFNQILNSELLPNNLKKIYQVYKETNSKSKEEKDGKRAKGKRRKAVTNGVELSEEQFLDYLRLMNPNSQEKFQTLITEFSGEVEKSPINKMEVLSEHKVSNKPTRKFRTVKNLFSKLSSKSDDEGDTTSPRSKRSLSSSSLTSLSELLVSTKKALSLTEISSILQRKPKAKSDESGYESDYVTMQSTKSKSNCISKNNFKNADGALNTDNKSKPPTFSTMPSKSQQNKIMSCDENRAEKEVKKQCRSKFRLSVRSKRPRSESGDAVTHTPKKSTNVEKNDDLPKTENDLSELCSKKLDRLSLNSSSLTAYPTTTLQSYQRYSSTLPSPTEKDFKCIRLKVQENEDIGVTISVKKNSGFSSSYIISDITFGSIADKNGNLWIGDEVVKVNGTRLRGMPITLVANLLTAVNGELEIIVSRYAPTTTNRVNSSSPEGKFSSSTFSRYEHSKNDVSVKTQALYAKQALYNGPKPQSPQNCSREPQKPLTGMKKFSYFQDSCTRWNNKLEFDHNSTMTTASPNANHFVINFRKGPGMKSLGFSIVGGNDSPKGPMGVYIKTIFKQGQAAEDGNIREGDKILSINGISFDGLTHKEAISLFKNIHQGNVQLHIERRENFHHRSIDSSSI